MNRQNPFAMVCSRKLAACSSLAVGAGVGMLAAESSEAAVVPFSPPGGPVTIFQNGNFHFDIDGDGNNDFNIWDSYLGNFSLSDAFISSNRVMNDGFFAAVVSPGGTVGPDASAWPIGADLGHFSGIRGYAGVVFDIPGGSPHFGYLDISVVSLTSATLYGGAYESEPNTPIRVPVPEPGPLALLASGAAGLAVWRRKRGSTATNSAV